ncbi:DUF2442 domain-containing protein [Okeania sp. KiyG1]|uniref:DUF2442 domain-containing protein n=1 Tax=Okeania sp. KiyG1 TaxID=2720165 RepID=UPI001923A90F|nr:DUF2442 domain-containing protein [Okeania sp. KiyG1]GGA23500.1 hypothetical protein CYANOKiyG1_38770 [Okeania sp. KiyG1]
MSISTHQADERVKNVKIQKDTFSVELMNGRTITVPLVWYPRLLKATSKQRQAWKISGDRYGIYWEEIYVYIRTKGLLKASPAHQKSTNKKFKQLDISSKFILIYLSLKLIIFPVIQIVINIISDLKYQEKIADNIIKIPDTNFPDLILLIIILLLQPEASKIFKTLDLSPKGFKAEFKDLKNKVNKNQEEIDNFQQKQIDDIKKLQNFMFMYPRLLEEKMTEKLQKLKEHTEKNTDFKFKVPKQVASELRSLRDSGLIKIKRPYKYVSDLQRDSKDGQDDIDLTKYCELTKLGEDFLEKLALAKTSTETNNLK